MPESACALSSSPLKAVFFWRSANDTQLSGEEREGKEEQEGGEDEHRDKQNHQQPLNFYLCVSPGGAVIPQQGVFFAALFDF